MKTKALLVLLSLLLSSGCIKAQLIADTLFDEEVIIMYAEPPESKTFYTGLHGGLYYSAMELIPVQEDFFGRLFEDKNIPAVDLFPVHYLANISFMRNRMYSGISYSSTSSGNVEKNDSLISELNQYSLAAKSGYNFVVHKSVVVSSFAGLRYTRFKHLTNLRKRNLSLDEYLENPGIDLRVSQFSAEVGLNASFPINKNYSIQVFVSYLMGLDNYPIIRSDGNRIHEDIINPVKNNIIFGLSFGAGSHDFWD